MKKILGIVGLLSMGLVAHAANFVSESFLTVSSLYVTNTMGITNLLTSATHGTNVAGVAFTNNGVRVIVNNVNATTNLISASRNLLKDVQLWSNMRGDWPFPALTNSQATGILSPVTLSVTTTNSSGTVGVLTFVVTPVYNGVNEATETAQQWTFSLTPVASTTSTLVTNVPIYNWPGAKALRIRRITNTGAAANTEAIFTDLSLNGFTP